MVVRASGAFDNDMAKAMEKTFGMGEGKRVSWAFSTTQVPQVELDDTSEATMAKRAALREKAAAELVNIDDDDRSKRKLVGAGAGVVALLAAVGLSVGGVTNPLIRGAVMYLPLAMSFGLYGSGQKGL